MGSPTPNTPDIVDLIVRAAERVASEQLDAAREARDADRNNPHEGAVTMTTTAETIKHDEFCAELFSDPRIETFRADRWADDGVTRIGYAEVRRCLECGSQTVDGVRAP